MNKAKYIRTLRVSEIGAYLYCKRAWWLQQQGYRSGNMDELVAGVENHRKHGNQVLRAGYLRMAALFLLMIAFLLGTLEALS